MPDFGNEGIRATFDDEVDAYYFKANSMPAYSVSQVDLGNRHVILDVGICGNIIGIEVL
jgi:hypothetical protein